MSRNFFKSWPLQKKINGTTLHYSILVRNLCVIKKLITTLNTFSICKITHLILSTSTSIVIDAQDCYIENLYELICQSIYARRSYHQVFYLSRLQAAVNRSTVESNFSSLKGSVNTLNRLRSLIIVSGVIKKN